MCIIFICVTNQHSRRIRFPKDLEITNNPEKNFFVYESDPGHLGIEQPQSTDHLFSNYVSLDEFLILES